MLIDSVGPNVAIPKDPNLSTRRASSSNHSTFKDLVMSHADALLQSHALISNNISNVTTPGYKSRELRLPQSYKELLEGGGLKKGKLRLTRTSSSHLQSSYAAPSSFPTVMQTDVEEKPNGNNVSLVGEIGRLDGNRQKFSGTLSSYSSLSSLERSVVGKE